MTRSRALGTVFVTRDALFTREECQQVVQEAEQAAGAKGWSTSRHYSVPTTDIPLHTLPEALSWFNRALQVQLFPMLAEQFGHLGVSADKLRIHDAFIVKYDAAARRELPVHTDQSQYSFTIALNSVTEYTAALSLRHSENQFDQIRRARGQLSRGSISWRSSHCKWHPIHHRCIHVFGCRIIFAEGND
ncbi:hypothetical protein CYMTET_52188 [Cymbomonas tetramitiformis]|uniref:Uncharacterized protein n=1 Tax=Cymbomonas tetramitiformis TaxID=36881 RepID=A0AAE0ER16_9CHLO|nr:hypothetical protein CYMTET_52188 [Cymbomonas tetramitiformis]